MHLSDKIDEPMKWKIPTGLAIPPHGHVVFWCDAEPGQGSLHTNFKLGAGGDWVGLFSSTGRALVDDVAFGPQRDDVSAGCFDDGGALWVTHRTPTPTKPNSLACGSRGYGARDPFLHRFELSLVGLPKIGTSPTLRLDKGPKSKSVILVLATNPGHLTLDQNVVLLLGPKLLAPVVIPTDANGAFALKIAIPKAAATVGASVCLQLGGTDAAGFTASNGLHVVICK